VLKPRQFIQQTKRTLRSPPSLKALKTIPTRECYIPGKKEMFSLSLKALMNSNSHSINYTHLSPLPGEKRNPRETNGFPPWKKNAVLVSGGKRLINYIGRKSNIRGWKKK
jgi:hypothetical protein